jgi:YegS/Rv2252/BmrU family lipid kinase
MEAGLPIPSEAAGAPAHSIGAAPARRLLVLHNPIAGSRQQHRLEAVLAALRERGCAVTVRITSTAGEPRRFAASASPAEFDAVIAAGGDGTVNEVANGLAETASALALGVIPLGTANVFAHNLGLPRAPAALAALLAEAPAAPFLPGRVNGRLFVAVAGIGFDARVVAGVDTGLKHRVGKAAYLWQSLIELGRGRARSFRVRLRGEELWAAGLVALRGPHYGGGFTMAPRAGPGRPDFALCCLAGGGRSDILRQGLALGLGRFHRLAGLTHFRTTAAEVLGPADEPIQADGDLVGHLPASIDMARAPIRLVGLSAPAPTRDGSNSAART